MSTLDDKIRDYSGKEKHDLSKVVAGDMLVRDMYNNRSYNGVFNVVSIDKKTRILLMSNGNYVNPDGTNRSGIGVYRLPLRDEIEKETTLVLWRRLCFFDYEFLPKDLLIRLNNILDNHLDRRAARRADYAASRASEGNGSEKKFRKEPGKSTESRSSPPTRTKLSWGNIGRNLDDGETSWKPKKKKKSR